MVAMIISTTAAITTLARPTIGLTTSTNTRQVMIDWATAAKQIDSSKANDHSHAAAPAPDLCSEAAKPRFTAVTRKNRLQWCTARVTMNSAKKMAAFL